MMKQGLLLKWVLFAGAVSVCPFSNARLYTDFEPCSISNQLSPAESHDLQYAVEEVKLSRDVYLALYSYFDRPIFSDFPKSEAHHLATIQKLSRRYEQIDPVEALGIFRVEHFQKLHADLIQRGSKSHREALLVAAFLEELAISDFRDTARRTKQEDLRIMCDQLYGVSIRHFRTVVAIYEAEVNESYKAQKLSPHAMCLILGR